MYFVCLKYLMSARVLNAPRAWVQKKSAPGGKVFPCLQCLRRAQEENRLPQHWKRALYHRFGQRLCYNLPIDLHCLRVQTCYPRFRILRILPRSTLFRRGLLLRRIPRLRSALRKYFLTNWLRHIRRRFYFT